MNSMNNITGKLFLMAWGLCLPSAGVFSQQSFSLTKNKDGVTVYPGHPSADGVKAVRLQVITEKVMRVTASPQTEMDDRESLVVVKGLDSISGWAMNTKEKEITVSTSALTAAIDKNTGAISFFDKNGKPVIAERNDNGRNLQPVVLEGEPMYRLKQTFETSEDDAYFGLGQHQDDLWNYKGRQVVLFQNNTEVAVPFLVSVKNYGILWDNYSFSKVGDVREFQPLSTLKLFDRNNEQGWLTATYFNDRRDTSGILFAKAESGPDYPYLNDTKQKLPASFNVEKGMIQWEGSIAAEAPGKYALKFTYGGYFKCWLEGKQIFDKWRQSWNPGTGITDLLMEKGKRYHLKIQWIPDGGESYFSAEVLPPQPDKDQQTICFLSEAGRQIDYYFVYGENMDEVIHGYRLLTGKAPVVPRWAMGFWQSRERYKTQDELLQTVDQFRKRKIPLDNIVQDWFYWKENEWGSQEFDRDRFPSPDSMISLLHKKYHARFMISVWPKFYEGIPVYREFNKNNWLYKRNIADRQPDWVGPGYVSTFYDVFNKEARTAFWELLKEKLFVKGVDAWWMDASEPDILSNVSPMKRKELMSPTALGTAAEYLNAYPLQNAKGIYEGQRNTDPGKRVFLLTRSAFAGSQRYAASIWSGDIASRWEDMRTQITAGMNYSLSGLPYWTMDIGGFAVEKRYEKPGEKDLEEWRELQTRWYQWGSFLPLFRAHGQYPYREVFNIAPEDHPAYKSILYYIKLRYRLLPYAYTLAGMAFQDDYTILRGLVMDFAKDRNAAMVSDQFMFGPSFMVCPVYTRKATKRQVYLPTGQGWYDLYTGKFLEGGRYLEADAPYERVPVFVKAGSVIPAGPELQYTEEKQADPLTLFIYTGQNGSFTLYEDEGVNYNYEKGAFSRIPFTYDNAKNKLTIGNREGSFPGMLKNRTFIIKVISASLPVPVNFDSRGKRVNYKGKEITLNL